MTRTGVERDGCHLACTVRAVAVGHRDDGVGAAQPGRVGQGLEPGPHPRAVVDEVVVRDPVLGRHERRRPPDGRDGGHDVRPRQVRVGDGGAQGADRVAHRGDRLADAVLGSHGRRRHRGPEGAQAVGEGARRAEDDEPVAGHPDLRDVEHVAADAGDGPHRHDPQGGGGTAYPLRTTPPAAPGPARTPRRR